MSIWLMLELPDQGGPASKVEELIRWFNAPAQRLSAAGQYVRIYSGSNRDAPVFGWRVTDIQAEPSRLGNLRTVFVQVCGQKTMVTVSPSWTIGAIATKARWQTDYGAIPFDEWEVRDSNGVLLDPAAMPGEVSSFVVERKPGVGG